mmetsp:Transcript_39719/g.91830  ORF Transcript_39719/g.91830 Transcript_39719/m.91830 type:complete len:594 (-) Transcript_39719:77-1858(-)
MAVPVPAEYVTFSGQVIEGNISEDSTRQAFEDTFSLSRFREAFASKADGPLMVGIDFEWKPDRGHDNNRIALMQFACWDTVMLIRTIGCSELPAWLSNFLETGLDIIKITASFDTGDKAKLAHSFGWEFDKKAIAASYWDIAELADARSMPHGLLKLAHHLETPIQKLKSVGTSNWARSAGLSPEQRAYAADDAFFQLYLFGKLLAVRAAESPAEERLLKTCQVMEPKLKEAVRTVDNSAYQANFLALRKVVQDAVDVLSKALGSGGCTNLNELLAYRAVRKAVASQKTSRVQVNSHFLRQNGDIFVVFFRDGLLKVRPRLPNQCEEEDEPVALQEEEMSALVSEVQELLAAYEPPTGKKQSVINRTAAEVLWVPARAILTKAQIASFEASLNSGGSDSVETSYDTEDGLLLRLVRHPRAPDDIEYMDRSVRQLQDNLEIDAEDAKRRLNSDEKFMQFWSLLRSVEVNSAEETAIDRSLRARTRILADSQRLALRISKVADHAVSWEEAKEKLEQVKWYRQLLGQCLESEGVAIEDMEECLAAVTAAWPDVKSIQRQKRKAEELQSEGKRAKTGKGQAKGKGKGKNKVKGKSS